MKVGIVAGEKSGDYLGAELIKALREIYPTAEFVGLCGPAMQAQGATSLAEMDKISLFGLDGLLGALRDILSIRKRLLRHFLDWRPDVFIGIDVPDFNLPLARKLKRAGMTTVHYVSPTVWAWRGGRIKKIRQSTDLMLTLFPFEEHFYQQHKVPVRFVGHPLAAEISQWQVDPALQQRFSSTGQRLIALLPGSRTSEVSRLAEPMLAAAADLHRLYPDLHFVLPTANEKIAAWLEQHCDLSGQHLSVVHGHSRDVLALCDLALLASGTAALEAALFAKPMVVMYRISKLSALVYGHTIEVEHYSMPNHLTPKPVVPELVQDQATAEDAVRECRRLLEDQDLYQATRAALAEITPALHVGGAPAAAKAIKQLLLSHAG